MRSAVQNRELVAQESLSRMQQIMIAEITGGISAAKHSFDLLKGIAKLQNDVAINSAIIEAQQSIIDIQNLLRDAQSRYDELAELKRQADMALRDRDLWESEASKFELIQLDTQMYAYILRDDGSSLKVLHCCGCFNKRKKSVLQRKVYNNSTLKCHECGAEFIPNPHKTQSE
jgi:hypothetical protein